LHAQVGEQGYRSALGILSLNRKYGPERLEAACDRALSNNTVNYSSVMRMPRLFEDMAMARVPPSDCLAITCRAMDGRFPRLVDKLARVELLILPSRACRPALPGNE